MMTRTWTMDERIDHGMYSPDDLALFGNTSVMTPARHRKLLAEQVSPLWQVTRALPLPRLWARRLSPGHHMACVAD